MAIVGEKRRLNKEDLAMFHPQFCPNPLCIYHRGGPKERRWYHRTGSYSTEAFGAVQRYRCLHCRSGFSEQTFALDYYVKHPLSYREVFDRITAGGGLRSTGRSLKLSHQGIANRIGRLARQAMGLQAGLTAGLQLQEDLVVDGFESFVTDQYMPNNIHLLAGARSQFLYLFDYAHLRRKGRMSERQKHQRAVREREYLREPISISASFVRIIDEVEQLIGQMKTGRTLILDSDERKEYVRIINRSTVLQTLKARGSFLHRRTNSKVPRTPANRLFAVNYLDRQIRKDNANHVRETVQFSRDVNNCMERMAVYQMYHNFFKPYRVEGRQGRALRHGQVAGIDRRRIDRNLKEIFHLRLFFSHVRLSFSQLLLWARMIGNRDRHSGGYWPQYVWM